MADENGVPENTTPKESRFSKMRPNMPKVDMDRVKDRGRKVANFVKKFAIGIAIVAALILGFTVGARMHELGYTEGMMGKDLKGATVVVSGPCTMLDGGLREPSLAEDEVKVTSVQDGKILGVVRKTREVVECKISEVAIDKLPLLSNIGKSPAVVPALTMAQVSRREQPKYKELENKVLLVSGVCRSQTGEQLPPFTDERLDVTSVEESRDVPGSFIISGIRRSDKSALACVSRSIKYSVVDPNEAPEAKPAPPLTFINKVLVINSRCVPDPRIQPAPRGPDGRKVAFFRLVNSPVQILEETIRDGKLTKFTGTIVDKKMKDAFGLQTVCDTETYPMTYQIYDQDDIILDRNDAQRNNPTAETGSSAVLEDATPAPQPTTPGRVVPPTRMRVPPPQPQQAAPDAQLDGPALAQPPVLNQNQGDE